MAAFTPVGCTEYPPPVHRPLRWGYSACFLDKNVISIQPRNSFDEAGIQFVDNLCSVIRHSFSDDNNEFYLLIKENVIRV